MIASQKNAATTASQISRGLQRTCMKKSITKPIFVNAIKSATSVFAPGKYTVQVDGCDEVCSDRPDHQDAKYGKISGNANMFVRSYSGCV